MKVGDRVRCCGAEMGVICRLERKWGRDGAHVQTGGQFTTWYPLASLKLVDEAGSA